MKRQKAYKKAGCGRCCYGTWWIVSLLYVLGIIFIIITMGTCFGMPSSITSFMNKKTTTVTQVIDGAGVGIDNLINSVFG